MNRAELYIAYLFYRCPRNWVRYIQSCYKFTRSPIKRWDDARLQCQAYRHQDSDNSGMKLTTSSLLWKSNLWQQKCYIINANKFEFWIFYGGTYFCPKLVLSLWETCYLIWTLTKEARRVKWWARRLTIWAVRNKVNRLLRALAGEERPKCGLPTPTNSLSLTFSYNMGNFVA